MGGWNILKNLANEGLEKFGTGLEILENLIIGSWNNWNISFFYTIGLTIPAKVGTLSIIKCNGFSFFVHNWGK